MTELINTVLAWLVLTSIHASLIVIALVLLQRLFRHTLKPGWRYYLWLFLMIRLLVPAGFEVKLPERLSGILPASFQTQTQHSQPNRNSNVHQSSIETLNVGDSAFKSVEPSTNRLGPNKQGPTINATSLPDFTPVHGAPLQRVDYQSVRTALLILWLAGFVFALVKWAKNARSVRRMIMQCSVCRESDMTAIANEVSQQMGIKRAVQLKWCAKLSSPASSGAIRPVILLPLAVRQLQPAQLSMVFRHELIHHKRFDIPLNACMQLLNCIHWFNPLIGYAAKQMRMDCELSCDYRATRRFDRPALYTYGDLLIQFASGSSRRAHPMSGLSAMSEQARQVAARIRSLGATQCSVFLSYLKTAVACASIVLVGFTTPINASIEASLIKFDSGLGGIKRELSGISNDKRYNRESVSGWLTRPRAKGRFPALVLVSGCDGLSDHHESWANEFAESAYVTLRIWRQTDAASNCDDSLAKINTFVSSRLMDAFAALEYLSQQPFVDADNISIMSWQSWAALGAAAKYGVGQVYAKQFKSAIALYPDCSATYNGEFTIPLQILVGAKDDWAHAEDCVKIERYSRLHSDIPIALTLYPEAYHGFDDLQFKPARYVSNAKNLANLSASGAIGKYSALVHHDAQARVKTFLRENALKH